MNNDLISRSALLAAIENYCGDYLKHGDDAFDKTAVRMVIKAAPAVDVVEVVRCRDCKDRGFTGVAPFMYHYCRNPDGLSGRVRETDFCPYGERRDDDAID